jgi:hypothetical protein
MKGGTIYLSRTQYIVRKKVLFVHDKKAIYTYSTNSNVLSSEPEQQAWKEIFHFYKNTVLSLYPQKAHVEKYIQLLQKEQRLHFFDNYTLSHETVFSKLLPYIFLPIPRFFTHDFIPKTTTKLSNSLKTNQLAHFYTLIYYKKGFKRIYTNPKNQNANKTLLEKFDELGTISLIGSQTKTPIQIILFYCTKNSVPFFNYSQEKSLLNNPIYYNITKNNNITFLVSHIILSALTKTTCFYIEKISDLSTDELRFLVELQGQRIGDIFTIDNKTIIFPRDTIFIRYIHAIPQKNLINDTSWKNSLSHTIYFS